MELIASHGTGNVLALRHHGVNFTHDNVHAALRHHGANSVKCELTWLTTSTTSWTPTHFWNGVCHKHLQIRAITKQFWRDRWMAVLQYVREHTSLRYVTVTDMGDIHLNPFTANEIIDQFRLVASGRSVLISTEMTCWIGKVCNKEDAQKFKTVFPKTGRFMHSQYMGTRDGLLHMLNWGANTMMTDDMHIIYEYALLHNEQIAFDTNQMIFGSFAVARLDEKGGLMCWSGKCRPVVTGCYRYERRICDTVSNKTTCPALWHMNGLAAVTRRCKDLLKINRLR